MAKLVYPERIYSLSDCHGGQQWNPFTSPDVAARLAQDIRSDLPAGIQSFDTFGMPVEYFHHMLREACRLHEKKPDSGSTGIFINDAPRRKKGVNGAPFYRAEFDNRLVVVATPIEVLAGVRDKIKKLQVLPNSDNGLYSADEQHRSSFTPQLLTENHGLNLVEANLDAVPKPREDFHLTYVDRFGNLVLMTSEDFQEHIRRIINFSQYGKPEFKIKIGSKNNYVTVASSLQNGDSGELLFYPNDGNIEVVSKWHQSWQDPEERLKKSAYGRFGKPQIGAEVNLERIEEIRRDVFMATIVRSIRSAGRA